MGDQYQVYILINPQGRHYIGLSSDIHQRLNQHNEGKSKWTAKYRPWILFWHSPSMSLSDARKLEHLLKRQKGGSGLPALLAEYGQYVTPDSKSRRTA